VGENRTLLDDFLGFNLLTNMGQWSSIETARKIDRLTEPEISPPWGETPFVVMASPSGALSFTSSVAIATGSATKASSII
jgi:hypothetical protein